MVNDEGYPAFLHEALSTKFNRQRVKARLKMQNTQLITASVSAFSLYEHRNKHHTNINLISECWTYHHIWDVQVQIDQSLVEGSEAVSQIRTRISFPICDLLFICEIRNNPDFFPCSPLKLFSTISKIILGKSNLDPSSHVELIEEFISAKVLQRIKRKTKYLTHSKNVDGARFIVFRHSLRS